MLSILRLRWVYRWLPTCLFVLHNACLLYHNKSEFVLPLRSYMILYLLRTPITQSTVFGQCLSVYNILRWLYSMNFISLSVSTFHLSTNGPRSTFPLALENKLPMSRSQNVLINTSTYHNHWYVVVTWHVNFYQFHHFKCNIHKMSLLFLYKRISFGNRFLDVLGRLESSGRRWVRDMRGWRLDFKRNPESRKEGLRLGVRTRWDIGERENWTETGGTVRRSFTRKTCGVRSSPGNDIKIKKLREKTMNDLIFIWW